MKTIVLPINVEPNYPVENLAPLDQILYIDIETTGFTARSSILYLVGCMYYSDDSWNLIQWFAEDKDSELDILKAFLNFARSFSLLIHYNGNQFDIPYIMEKCREYELECTILSCNGLDLYKRISPYHHLLHLENCKQKTVEKFLGISRDGDTDPKELIGVYNAYTQNPDEDALERLILHNANDLRGLVKCTDILAYYDLFHNEITATKVSAHRYTDYYNNPRSEVWIHVTLPTPLPVPCTVTANDCRFSAQGNTGKLRVPVFEGTLRYFYPDYHDYYYLPNEDIAVHKSVSSYVDKSARIQANARNCYTNQAGMFLPMWGHFAEPFFRTEYKSKQLYFALSDEIKSDRQLFRDYAEHILQMMAEHGRAQ